MEKLKREEWVRMEEWLWGSAICHFQFRPSQFHHPCIRHSAGMDEPKREKGS